MLGYLFQAESPGCIRICRQALNLLLASLEEKEEGNWSRRSSLNEGSLTFREQPTQRREKGEEGRIV